MHFIIPITAFSFVFAGALVTTFLQNKFTKNKTTDTPEGFLLANKNLGKLSVLNLFLSTSFGMAAFFYAVWLGYSIGFWGFVLQATWSLGFLFLIPFTKKIKTANSLHDFLGKQFGAGAKLLSAVCYLLSILFLMAWEARIAQKPIADILAISKTAEGIQTLSPSVFAIVILVLVVLFYTFLGGLKGNATVDKFLNLIKIISIVLLAFWLGSNFISFSRLSFSQALFPSFSAIKENLGVWGLATNILLNLFSQFTDGASWQNIIAGSKEQNSQRNLKISSLLIFLTIGFFGSLIGVLLAGAAGITTNNAITAPIKLLHGYEPVIAFTTMVLITACIMSLLNSTLLVTTRIVSINILQLDNNNGGEKQKIYLIKLIMIVIAIVSIGGINYIINLTGLNIFELIYIFMVFPFCYFGPVVAGLNNRTSKNMSVVILIATIIGLTSVIIGIATEAKFLVDGAATITLLVSLALAYFFSGKHSVSVDSSAKYKREKSFGVQQINLKAN